MPKPWARQSRRARMRRRCSRGRGAGRDIAGHRRRAGDRFRREFSRLQLELPNILHASVPEGRDESANVEVRRWGEPR